MVKNYNSGHGACVFQLAEFNALLMTLQTDGMKMIHPVRERWSRGFEHSSECHKDWINIVIVNNDVVSFCFLFLQIR